MRWGQLHLHTRQSDGDITPEMIRRAGLQFVAATDHDTLGGADRLRSLSGNGIEVIRGIELTVRVGGKRLHVVAIDPDPDPALAGVIETLQTQRIRRMERIIAVIETHGIDLSRLPRGDRPWPTKREISVAALALSQNAIRLAELGIDSHRTFGRYFYHGGPADFRVDGVPADAALPHVRGPLILAHPARSLKLPADVPIIAHLKERFGLMGIEVVTRKHLPADVVSCARIARDLGLLPVFANDVHSPEHLSENRTPGCQLARLRRARAEK